MVEKDLGHRSTARLFLVIIRYQPVKQPYAEAGAPALIDVGLGRSHAGAGDVEMGPWGFIDETLEELCRGNRARVTAAGVLHVGEFGIDQLVVFGTKRHAPDALDRKSVV